jgi:PAS domain S-box-containing protein
MTDHTLPAYEIDARWQIVSANNAFCRTLQCTESSLIGRDARELVREDWRHDFRHYVARALVGVGDVDVTVPLVAPCGKEAWFKHELEPLMNDGLLAGYRATIRPHAGVKQEDSKHWWEWRPVAARQVWDFDVEQLAHAS